MTKYQARLKHFVTFKWAYPMEKRFVGFLVGHAFDEFAEAFASSKHPTDKEIRVFVNKFVPAFLKKHPEFFDKVSEDFFNELKSLR